MPTLRDEFAKALQEYFARGEEAGLLSAYDLGRKALAEGHGVLDVATMLHEALAAACRETPADAAKLVLAAQHFNLECLSPFEMAYRAVREANNALRGLNDLLEEQTRRISHELHDQASQLVASVYLALEEIARDLPADLATRVRAVHELLDRVEEQLRRLSHELRPTILDDVGLVAAIEFLAEGIAARNRLQVVVDGPRDKRFPEAIETVLYRVVQEALTNVCKHARASRAEVRLRREGRHICCTIRDDGAGFDAAVIGKNPKGIGLIGIRERLAPLGGSVQVSASPGQGTELFVTIPEKLPANGPGGLRPLG
jgi:signal transduction histidine kinase